MSNTNNSVINAIEADLLVASSFDPMSKVFKKIRKAACKGKRAISIDSVRDELSFIKPKLNKLGFACSGIKRAFDLDLDPTLYRMTVEW